MPFWGVYISWTNVAGEFVNGWPSSSITYTATHSNSASGNEPRKNSHGCIQGHSLTRVSTWWDWGFFFFFSCFILCCFPSGSVVKNPPSMQETQETWVWSLGGEDPLEKEMATHSRILACRIPWTEEPGGLQSMGSQSVGHNWATKHMVPAPIQLTLGQCRLWRSCVLGMENLPITWQPALPTLSSTFAASIRSCRAAVVHISWKNIPSQWAHNTIQTHVVQGSTVASWSLINTCWLDEWMTWSYVMIKDSSGPT